MAKYSVDHMERKIILTKKFESDAKKLGSVSYEMPEFTSDNKIRVTTADYPAEEANVA